ncbi:biotin--[acetyl-CoA-carboxylase] ligase [Flavobacterium sp. 20NA77.7]|uniref:Biotin--[acetyl-CoA-carboxylase] ligase n=1 Tax=Flavobacterium nakdongensis TaxID=3073563 RepID=A0ABY9RB33_9FLAO|nr:biotin--[acetyl-CoA-carboxylase] ligase [Flavobacterium sp. 20NA77.7]WMW78452.1 biotin--[acetyl-CoA-carboxylase] ligase [Flavobacterium sp. 20NA77.7]
MYIIKLSAIDSTNSYLKELVSQKTVENLAVVWTTNQTNGRGQMGASWISEQDKNLTFSVLVKDVLKNINEVFDLNVCVAVTLIEVLKEFNLPKLAIKWPNDILADQKKIGGVLIENSIKSAGEYLSIVGIGINVNQDDFSGLPQASSIKNISGITVDIEVLLRQFLHQFELNLVQFQSQGSSFFWESYHKYLFKCKQPAAFEKQDGTQFMGIIRKVTQTGFLQIQLEDDAIQEFEVKSIKLLF